MIRRVAPFLILIAASLFGPSPAFSQEPVRVFAAASLTEPLTRLIDQMDGVEGVFGASGTLARQIEAGAPADIFISANPRWSSYLIDQGIVTKDNTRSYLRNRLVVISPKDGAIALPFDANALDAFTQDRLAIGDPDHVPAGQYAKQSLEAIGLWQTLSQNAVRAANVRATLAFVEQGAVGYGIVYASDALASDRVTVVAEIPDSLHDPIIYTLTLLSNRPEAKAVQQRLLQSGSYDLLTSFGFLPVETN